MTPGRRTLRYPGLDEIMPDVDRLLEGHTTVGNWSLRADLPPPGDRHAPGGRPARVDAPRRLPVGRRGAEDGSSSSRAWSPRGSRHRRLLPAEALDEREEAEGLRQAIAHYKASPGPVVPHVLFGPLTREEWDRFHCIHAAHHLSFAVPNAPPG